MLCNGFTIPNFNQKKRQFLCNVTFTCTWIKFFTKSIQIIKKQERQIVAKYARLTRSYNNPRNFIAIASIVLEICASQNSSMEINKGQ